MVTVVSLGGLGHAEVKLRTGVAGHCLRAVLPERPELYKASKCHVTKPKAVCPNNVKSLELVLKRVWGL